MKGESNTKRATNFFFIFVNYALWAFLFAVGIADLFNQPSRSIVWFGTFAVLVFIYVQFKQVPHYVHFLLSVMAILNVFGEVIFAFYYVYAPYDKILHIVNPFAYCLVAYHLFKNKIQDTRVLVFLSVTAVIAVGAGWEIFEFLFDKVFNTFMQGVNVSLGEGGRFFGIAASGPNQILDQLNDTMVDMICNIFGTLIFATGFYLVQKRKVFIDQSKI